MDAAATDGLSRRHWLACRGATWRLKGPLLNTASHADPLALDRAWLRPSGNHVARESNRPANDAFRARKRPRAPTARQPRCGPRAGPVAQPAARPMVHGQRRRPRRFRLASGRAGRRVRPTDIGNAPPSHSGFRASASESSSESAEAAHESSVSPSSLIDGVGHAATASPHDRTRDRGRSCNRCSEREADPAVWARGRAGRMRRVRATATSRSIYAIGRATIGWVLTSSDITL